MQQFVPFDVSARQHARDRAAGLIAGRGQVLAHVADELAARRDLLGEAPDGPELVIGLLHPPAPHVAGMDPSPLLAAPSTP